MKPTLLIWNESVMFGTLVVWEQEQQLGATGPHWTWGRAYGVAPGTKVSGDMG